MKMGWFSWAAMEIIWRYAWALFISRSAIERPFPLSVGIGAFVLAAVFGAWTRSRGWRMISLFGLHGVGFTAACLVTAYFFYFPSEPFFRFLWISRIPDGRQNLEQWLTFFGLLVPVVFFWTGGTGFSRRPFSRSMVWIRFDLGVAAFFGLLFFNYALRFRDPVPEGFIIPFFIFGLMTLGSAGSGCEQSREYLSGYRGIGVILGFITAVFLLSAGIMAFSLPYLTAAAEFGYEVIRPLGPAFTSVLLFFFGHRPKLREERGSGFSTGGGDALQGSTEDPGPWARLFEIVFGWGMLGAIFLLMLAVAAVGLWWFFRWLMSRNGPVQTRKNFSFRPWLAVLGALMDSWGAKLRRLRRRKAARVYGRLLGWGRRSGASRLPGETPLEYGFRLKNRFPGLQKEIIAVIDAYQEETYGEKNLPEPHLKKVRRSFRRMCSPLQWPRRIWSGLLGFGSWKLETGNSKLEP